MKYRVTEECIVVGGIEIHKIKGLKGFRIVSDGAKDGLCPSSWTGEGSGIGKHKPLLSSWTGEGSGGNK